jgi:hypothetical protein
MWIFPKEHGAPRTLLPGVEVRINNSPAVRALCSKKNPPPDTRMGILVHSPAGMYLLRGDVGPVTITKSFWQPGMGTPQQWLAHGKRYASLRVRRSLMLR